MCSAYAGTVRGPCELGWLCLGARKSNPGGEAGGIRATQALSRKKPPRQIPEKVGGLPPPFMAIRCVEIVEIGPKCNARAFL
jgi:hypothetical protein